MRQHPFRFATPRSIRSPALVSAHTSPDSLDLARCLLVLFTVFVYSCERKYIIVSGRESRVSVRNLRPFKVAQGLTCPAAVLASTMSLRLEWGLGPELLGAKTLRRWSSMGVGQRGSQPESSALFILGWPSPVPAGWRGQMAATLKRP